LSAEGATQPSPGRKPWELAQDPKSALKGMRVKLSRIPKALKARCSKAQGGGARTAGSGTLGFRMELSFSPERATQAFA